MGRERKAREAEAETPSGKAIDFPLELYVKRLTGVRTRVLTPCWLDV
jgi:hypothetical protein